MEVREMEGSIECSEWKQRLRGGSLLKLSPDKYGGEVLYVICIPDHGKDKWILADVRTGEIQFLLGGTEWEDLVYGLDKIQESGQFNCTLLDAVVHATELGCSDFPRSFPLV